MRVNVSYASPMGPVKGRMVNVDHAGKSAPRGANLRINLRCKSRCFRSRNRHRRRAMGSPTLLILSHFLTFGTALIPSFLTRFTPRSTGQDCQHRPVTPWFKAGLGHSVTFLTFWDYSCSRGVFVRFSPSGQLHRGFTEGWDTFLPGITRNNGSKPAERPEETGFFLPF